MLTFCARRLGLFTVTRVYDRYDQLILTPGSLGSAGPYGIIGMKPTSRRQCSSFIGPAGVLAQTDDQDDPQYAICWPDPQLF